MRAYQSPKGVLYNLDNFALFELTNSRITGPGIDENTWNLEAETTTGRRVVMHSGSGDDGQKECRREQSTINRELNRTVTRVVVENDFKQIVQDIKEEMAQIKTIIKQD